MAEIEVDDKTLAALRAVAERKGMTLDETIAYAIEHLLGVDTPNGRS